MHSHIVAYVICLTLSASVANSESTEGSSNSPAVEVRSFQVDGQMVAWDFTLCRQAAKLPTRSAGSGLMEFVDASDPQRAFAVALAEATLAVDGRRTSLRGRTEIGERFAEGYYLATLKYPGGEAVQSAAALGVLVVKHRRQFISFIPDNPKSTAYPPEICAWTDEVKHAQREAGRRLMRQIDTAVKQGKKELTFPRGDYRLTLRENARSGRSRYFDWQGLEDFTLDGQGSTLWFDTLEANGFQLSRCRNLTFKNLVFDYDPLPFVQGRVVAIDEKAKKLRFRLDEGFEESLQPLLANQGLLRIHAFYNDASRGRVMKNDWAAGFVSGKPIVPLGDGVYECGIVLRYWPPQASGLALGDAIALCPRWGGSGFAIAYCDHLRFENITMYAVGLGGTSDRFSAPGGGKGSVYESVRIMRRPNTRRLVSTNSDGLHIKSMGKGLAVTNCVFEGTMDDSLPVQTFNPLVVKQIAPTEIVIAQRSASVPILLGQGHTIEFYDVKTLAPKGGARIVRIEPYTEEGLAGREAARRRFVWNPTRFYQVTLATPQKLDPMDMIIWAECPAAADFRIENCFFYSGWARSLLVTGQRGVIRNNTFEAGGRLNIGPSTSWLIGSFAQDLLIENNRLIDICSNPQAPGDGVPIHVSGPQSHPLNSKITIRNNTIERCAYSGIVVQGVDGLTITDNILRQTNLKHYEGGEDGPDLNQPIVTRACRNVIEKNNTVRP